MPRRSRKNRKGSGLLAIALIVLSSDKRGHLFTPRQETQTAMSSPSLRERRHPWPLRRTQAGLALNEMPVERARCSSRRLDVNSQQDLWPWLAKINADASKWADEGGQQNRWRTEQSGASDKGGHLRSTWAGPDKSYLPCRCE